MTTEQAFPTKTSTYFPVSSVPWSVNCTEVKSWNTKVSRIEAILEGG